MLITAERNQTLIQTSAQTPMGEVLRRYWHPFLLSSELPKPDCPPVKVHFLGEEFVAFRNSDGDVGAVEPHCPHRRANLFMGRNEECGLRCAFHGWKFDIHGNCLEIPNTTENVARHLKKKAKLFALEIIEKVGVIWARFPSNHSEKSHPPELSRFPFVGLPESHVHISKYLQKTNWVHAAEGAIDTSHFTFLHGPLPAREKTEGETPHIARFRWIKEDGAPTMNLQEHEAGMAVGAARLADDEQYYWRITQFLMPNMVLTPHAFRGENNFGSTWVPIDDVSTWVYNYAYNLERPLTPEERDDYENGRRGGIPASDENFYPLANPENDFLVDRELQASGKSYTGVLGVKEQDSAIQYSQGVIHDRTKELLVQTDLAVSRFREILLKAAADIANGEAPLGSLAPDHYNVGHGDTVSPRTETFEKVLLERFGSKTGLLGRCN